VIVRSTRRDFGQPDAGVLAASIPEAPPASVSTRDYFLIAVGSGLTVWFLTKILDRIWR
jgi:hypothetical protein